MILPAFVDTPAAHLPKEAIYGARGESAATYEGESASAKDTCRDHFKGADGKMLETYVEVYAPRQDKPPASPSDPFFQWKRAGKAYHSEKALSPKMAAAALTRTGIYYAGKDYIVMVSAMRSVYAKEEAKKLAAKIKWQIPLHAAAREPRRKNSRSVLGGPPARARRARGAASGPRPARRRGPPGSRNRRMD